ncbi:hypothetical protein ASPWEDRAFT_169999 [Aspergillus wentii DTO 134E9]|uniref:F-box domain-containing protein n=1 Tax=Aspergillus wentii DTO 134E9 TaxID=1073089 RepID=A0A1L9RNL6_ASPWE|nr:uncharacterized protein ASPWEDRAFT_169999 [Aspergillus wentii DTO 134E9]KAI9934372.1 hypothetical protein MW887_005449 [Aspergillus wentii]OJJ36482.1 hypothetical protein ASPWEDRAFT_169999 [Aspergillus wentii DTO 134E9]
MTDTRNLDTIPYDVFYQIASKLDCHDFIHLSRVNRNLNSLTQNESIARKTLENGLLHTKEGQKANKAKSGYRKAVGHLFDIKESFATAQPYSAAVLGYGSAFLYNGGSLCYVHDGEIRVLDVHASGKVEQVLNIYNIISRAIPGCAPGEDVTQLSLMHYSDGILAFMVEIVDRSEAWLLAMDLRRRTGNVKGGRLRLRTQLDSTRRLFVRHSRSYLYYGTHSSLGYHGYPQWAINCVDLRTGQHTTEKPVVLENFAGNEIGQTVCFGVHQDHFYAVSTQVNFEEEEVDWTSFYLWICLPPGGGKNRYPEPNRIWRRQHREGPINDTWTDLTLRHDEAAEQLMVLECRREWRDGGSENCRTYYMQALPSPGESSKGKGRQCHSEPSAMYAQLPDEPLTKTLDSSSKPNYERPRKRLRRHYHPEYHQGGEPSQRRDFILAKTKHRTYNLSASTFVDLVNDPRPDPGGRVPHDRLRLRMASRKRKCPIDEQGEEGTQGLLYRPEVDAEGQSTECSEERFASRGIHLWPPDDAPRELDELLCPSKRAGKVQAVADERSIIYSVDQPGMNDGKQAIIMVNFDPYIRLPGLKRLHPANLQAQKSDAGIGIERPQIGDSTPAREHHSIPLHTTIGIKPTNQTVPSVREEAAMYLRINHGYWLR